MGIVQQSFQRLHYPVEIILLCLRWYLAYGLSLRNLEEMMLERGIGVDHSTIHRWVLRLSPLLVKVSKKHRTIYSGGTWYADETYIKVKGKWTYLYRAVNANVLLISCSASIEVKSPLLSFLDKIYIKMALRIPSTLIKAKPTPPLWSL